MSFLSYYDLAVDGNSLSSAFVQDSRKVEPRGSMISMHNKGCLHTLLAEGGVWSSVVARKTNVCIVISKLSY